MVIGRNIFYFVFFKLILNNLNGNKISVGHVWDLAEGSEMGVEFGRLSVGCVVVI